MKHPTLGQAKGGPVRIDKEALVGSRMLLAASSGAGKSWTLRRLLEQLHGHLQELVLDPEGEFGTLRAKLDYVLVGRGGDFPADPRTAAVLARRLLELGVSAVLDLSELRAPERVAFVRRFLEGLIDAPRALWHQALVVLDEAHLFAPEKGHAESAAAVIDLMARGRKRGYAGVLATQRLSKLAKDAAAEAQNVLVGRFTLDLDRKRAAEILGFGGAEDRETIRRLRPGEFFAFGPALSEDVVRVRVGDVLTPHPKAGERGAAPPPPPAKVREALAALEDLARESEEEARTLDDYRARVAELARRCRAAETARPGPSREDLAAARSEGEVAGARAAGAALRTAVAHHERILGDAARHLEACRIAIEKACDAVRTPLDVEIPSVSPAQGPAPQRARPPARQTERPPPSSTPSAEGIDGPMQRVLDALAELEALGVPKPERVQVAFLAGYSNLRSKGFTNACGTLSTRGAIVYPASGKVALTPAGAALARPVARPRTTAELHERVLAMLGGAHARVLRPLLSAYPTAYERDELGAAAGYTNTRSKGFTNAMGRLRSLGFVDYPAPGLVRASAVLFPGGQ